MFKHTRLKLLFLVGVTVSLGFKTAIADDLQYCKQGWSATERNKHALAVTLFDRCIELGNLGQENLAQTYRNRGIANRRQAAFDEAIRDFTKAIELNHQDTWKDYVNRGNAWSGKGEYETALKDYKAAKKLKPNHHEVFYNRGIVYERMGKQDLAHLDFKKAYELGSRRKLVLERLKQNNAASLQRKQYDLMLELPDGFQLAFKDIKDTYQIHQYVPVGQSIKNWEQMVTIIVGKLNNPVPDMASLLLQHTLKEYQAQCRSSKGFSVRLSPTNLPYASSAAFCDDVDRSKVLNHIHTRKNGFIFIKAYGTPEAVYSFQYEWQSDDKPSSFVEDSGLLKDVVIPMMDKSKVIDVALATSAVASPKKPPVKTTQQKPKAFEDLTNAQIEMNFGDKDKAFNLAQAAIQSNSLPKVKLASAYILIGRVYKMRGSLDEAERAFTKSLQVKPDFSVYNLRGDVKYCIVKKLSNNFVNWNAELDGRLNAVMDDYENSSRMEASRKKKDRMKKGGPESFGIHTSPKVQALQKRSEFLKDRGAAFEKRNHYLKCPG